MTQPNQTNDLPDSQTKIWVDADACPGAIKDILFRTAKRLEVEVTLVANQSIRVPDSKFIHSITVRDGADIADNHIAIAMGEGDIVITSDIPLAARAVEKGGVAIGSRGELFDDATVHGRLASRNLMDQLRSAGMETSGPKPLSKKDVQTFANQLDRMLTKMKKRKRN